MFDCVCICVVGSTRCVVVCVCLASRVNDSPRFSEFYFSPVQLFWQSNVWLRVASVVHFLFDASMRHTKLLDQ